MFKSIKEIINAHRGHWFKYETMRFWNTKIETDVIGGRYFITSDSDATNTKRLYSVHVAQNNGDIRTVSFQEHVTLEETEAFLNERLSNGVL